ncbi:hypothetical protein SAMN02910292_00223 [Lachnospiraceae bacterium XBB2008]|nr:hypothetical protein SAMN02910292_00223 [Lachnospiraceae bacterium XBB2008]
MDMLFHDKNRNKFVHDDGYDTWSKDLILDSQGLMTLKELEQERKKYNKKGLQKINSSLLEEEKSHMAGNGNISEQDRRSNIFNLASTMQKAATVYNVRLNNDIRDHEENIETMSSHDLYATFTKDLKEFMSDDLLSRDTLKEMGKDEVLLSAYTEICSLKGKFEKLKLDMLYLQGSDVAKSDKILKKTDERKAFYAKFRAARILIAYHDARMAICSSTYYRDRDLKHISTATSKNGKRMQIMMDDSKQKYQRLLECIENLPNEDLDELKVDDQVEEMVQQAVEENAQQEIQQIDQSEEAEEVKQQIPSLSQECELIFGDKIGEAYSENPSLTYSDLNSLAKYSNTTIEFTGEALKQFSKLYLLRLIAGKENPNDIEDINLIYSGKSFGSRTVYTVTGAFMPMSEGFFSKTSPASLKKGSKELPSLDGLPLPVLDHEFVSSILAATPEDVLNLFKDQKLSKDKRDAIVSRFVWIKETLADKLDKEKELPLENRSIIMPTEWADPGVQTELKEKIIRNSRIMFPQMVQANMRLEGDPNSAKDEVDKKYYKIYSTIKNKIRSEKDPGKALLILARFKMGVSNGTADALLGNIHSRIIAWEMCQRIIDELLTEDMIKAYVKLEYEAQKRVLAAYNKIAKTVTEVPEEFRDNLYINEEIDERIDQMRDEVLEGEQFNEEEARQKVEAEVEEELRIQYIFYLMEQEDMKLAIDLQTITGLRKNLSEFDNKTMKIKHFKPEEIIADHSQKYALSLPEGAEGYRKNSEKANALFKRFNDFSLLDRNKTDRIKSRCNAQIIKLGLQDYPELTQVAQGNPN